MVSLKVSGPGTYKAFKIIIAPVLALFTTPVMTSETSPNRFGVAFSPSVGRDQTRWPSRTGLVQSIHSRLFQNVIFRAGHADL